MRLTSLLGDARELASEAGPLVDVILSDAPYSTVDRYRTGAESCLRLRQWFPTLTHAEILIVISELVRSRLKPGGFVLLACDFDTGLLLADLDEVPLGLMSAKGSKAPVGACTGLRWRCPWIWRKTYANGAPFMGMGYYGRRAWEWILVLQGRGTSSREVITKLRKSPNLISAPVVRNGYPTEKPPELGLELLAHFAPYGGSVLDPFAGAGAWILDLAAPLLELNVELWDINESASLLW